MRSQTVKIARQHGFATVGAVILVAIFGVFLTDIWVLTQQSAKHHQQIYSSTKLKDARQSALMKAVDLELSNEDGPCKTSYSNPFCELTTIGSSDGYVLFLPGEHFYPNWVRLTGNPHLPCKKMLSASNQGFLHNPKTCLKLKDSSVANSFHLDGNLALNETLLIAPGDSSFSLSVNGSLSLPEGVAIDASRQTAIFIIARGNIELGAISLHGELPAKIYLYSSFGQVNLKESLDSESECEKVTENDSTIVLATKELVKICGRDISLPEFALGPNLVGRF